MKFFLRALGCTLTLALIPSIVANNEEDDEEVVFELSPFEVSTSGGVYYSTTNTISATRIGATPGGAQDINYFRMSVAHGRIPHPNTFTPEGLFSEHDLPLDLGTVRSDPFYLETAAVPARFPAVPEITHLAQLSFKSGLDPQTWKRAPLNLVAVVDKSGSMGGQPIELVRQSLLQVISQMNPEDQLSIVLYGDQTHVHLPPTRLEDSNRAHVERLIDHIASSGSTFMEAGLQLGYQVARQSAMNFDGTTRVMLFTDERPNVGRTGAESFMHMAETASRQGIGLTTIGVGVQFGAELATKIAGVRGGNLFFYPDRTTMTQAFEENFDTMVTELAYDFEVKLAPAPGFEIAAVYGVPNETLDWDGDAIVLNVETIFLSRQRGGIFFGLKPAATARHLPSRGAPTNSGSVAEISLSYTDASSGITFSDTQSTPVFPNAASESLTGLRRGKFLVDEYLALTAATRVHHLENDQTKAYQVMHDLIQRQMAETDPSLAEEKSLTLNLHNALAVLSGNAPEWSDTSEFPLHGTWRLREGSDDSLPDYVIFWNNTEVEFGWIDENRKEFGTVTEHAGVRLTIDFEFTQRTLNLERLAVGYAVTLHEEDTPKAEAQQFILSNCAWGDLFANADTASGPKNPLTGLPAKRQW